ncbi:hypothetical protein [Tepidibacillus fermentans]|uniref:Uncharacterized protein n=1 Tax=Tepidibacillus fermentans TaxID=1281767 RepID=A0A4R3KKV8_9BACI|nr:hypothetical protein [Tepidibacillus fermentans]TCS84523.1 hypothetical protein EDD72_101192 [Tepidibacillus fermentans]
MQIAVKSLPKIIKPSSVVEEVFESQGFRRKGKKDSPYYQFKIEDVCTQTKYEVQIPIQEIRKQKQEPFYKCQEFRITMKSPKMRNSEIPDAIISAAKERVHEVFSIINHS